MFQADAGKKEHSEKRKITKLGRQPFVPGGFAEKEGVSPVAAEQTGEYGPEQQDGSEDKGDV